MSGWRQRFFAFVECYPQLVVVAGLVAVVAALCLPLGADARAGGGSHSGGGSYSGGGSSGGSGGGFSSGGGGALFFLPFLFSGGGVVGIIVLVGALFVFSRMSRRGGTTTASTGMAELPPGEYGPMGQPLGADGLGAIAANDPGFNEQQFLDRGQAAFFLLQQAWMDRNVDEGRAYMTSGLYQSWNAQVAAMTAAHKKNILENLFIEGMHIVRATHDDNYDTITVRVDARATDYEIDDQTGKKVFGDKRDESFTEYWTFQRSAGARTLTGGGVTEKKCPNCGAPLQVNQNGECHYCDAPVTSGKFDWVLSKIDQANEWA